MRLEPEPVHDVRGQSESLWQSEHLGDVGALLVTRPGAVPGQLVHHLACDVLERW